MKIILICIGLFFYSACIYAPEELYLASELVKDISDEDRRRRATTRRSRKENQCDDFDRCVDICDQLLDHAEDQEDCYKLSLKEIGQIEDVFISLKSDQDRSEELEEIKSKDFDLFIEYGARSWINIIQGDYRGNDDYGGRTPYRDSEKFRVFLWILSNSWALTSIEESSYGDLVLEEIFDQNYNGYDENEDVYKFLVLAWLLRTENSKILNIIDDTQLGFLLQQDYSVELYNDTIRKEVLFFILGLNRSTQRNILENPETKERINGLLILQDYNTYTSSELKDVCDFISDYELEDTADFCSYFLF